ncbi:metallophosphoesterase [Aureisphaera galaxeae]|uniref:metallophosphoesterase n=1 Tax=Aureisphaera galaxeae TaxID=1538023 RepID=UPI0023501112|nr:metallophosphoesterase [Aureisphaera galaxeae]MDC8004604.1 metallophosphoesterase [Aureisphaera galaxeae]
MKKVYTTISIALIFLLSSCATYKTKIAKEANNMAPNDAKEVAHTFYLIGDAGNAEMGSSTWSLLSFQEHIQGKDTSKDHLIFLGDNIYEKGMPKEGSPEEDEAKHRIDVQINAAKEFDGNTIFIPGNHDWYNGLSGLKRQEKRVEKGLGKNTFQPENGCPIEKINITDEIVVLAVDSQWYITDWNDHPTINDECDIKTRHDFILELEGELKKNNEKTILLAIHHPAITYGSHGGKFSLDKHLFPFQSKIPLPGLATLATQIRSQGGISPQDRYNVLYNQLMNRLITMAKGNDRLIMVSGHEHSLQYIDLDGVKQIVSGSGSKTSAASLGEGSMFSSGTQGFAELKVFTDGSSHVTFYGSEDGRPTELFSTEVHGPKYNYDFNTLTNNFPKTKVATTYEKEKTEKGKSYNWLWGDHYRYVYGTDLTVPVATLDTLYGGLAIERKGGGHQTRSLRVVDKKGRNFAIRGVKKSATQYLQTVLFTETYVEEDFEETVTEDLILDFYTASHPFASFVVAPLADAVGVFHTNPELLYIPKHKALGKYNAEFGDELYVIEERPDDGFLDVASFGKPDAIESTSDMMQNLRKDEEYQVDESAFIKARLFDMLLGDWDRHQDQWRWSRFDISKDEKVYRPIPRDRDQVFSYYDGALLDIAKVLIPSAGQLQKYNENFKDIKWLNAAGILLDRNFVQTSSKEEWVKQAKYIQESLTDEVIENAFTKLPKEVQDDRAEEIKVKLRSRRDQMEDLANRYYDYLSKLLIFTGTDKDDHIEITRGNGSTKISISRIKDGAIEAPYKERTVFSNETKEIWIYGLDDDDHFVVKGEGNNPVFIRIIGGQNNDIYTLENGRAVKVHDHKSKPNTVAKNNGGAIRFRDDYVINNYDFRKLITRNNSIIPSIGANPDDGLRIGLMDTYTVKGFKTDPFHQKHIFRAGYYFATQGFDLEYNGEFADAVGDWNFLIGGHFTSENFTRNFFGFGNETENFDDQDGVDFDFNRVKTAILSGKVGVVKNGLYGGRFGITAFFENIEVEDTEGRFISDFFSGMPNTFEAQNFVGAEMDYTYSSYDNAGAPSRGMHFGLKVGGRTNIDDTERTYGYIQPELQFYNSLTKDKKLVLRTMAQGQFNIGDSFEFYQAAVLGSGDGLRGYRTQRFSGESALAFGGDLRYGFRKFKTGILPLQLGIFGGADTGRVWLDGEDSDTWHSDVGGGLWINAVDTISGQLGIFSGDDGMRISFGFGVSL